MLAILSKLLHHPTHKENRVKLWEPYFNPFDRFIIKRFFRIIAIIFSILTPRVSVDNDALRRLEKKVHDLETLDRKHLDKIEKLQSENKISKEEKDDLLTRLSQAVSAKLRDNNPNIVDLSDVFRPTKLAEMFSELYDNEWTVAFSVLEEAKLSDSEAVSFLLDLVMESYEFSRDLLESNWNETEKWYIDEKMPTYQQTKQALKDGRKLRLVKLKEELCPKCIQNISELCTERFRKIIEDNGVQDYMNQCVKLSLFMCAADPPVHIECLGWQPRKLRCEQSQTDTSEFSMKDEETEEEVTGKRAESPQDLKKDDITKEDLPITHKNTDSEEKENEAEISRLEGECQTFKEICVVDDSDPNTDFTNDGQSISQYETSKNKHEENDNELKTNISDEEQSKCGLGTSEDNCEEIGADFTDNSQPVSSDKTAKHKCEFKEKTEASCLENEHQSDKYKETDSLSEAVDTEVNTFQWEYQSAKDEDPKVLDVEAIEDCRPESEQQETKDEIEKVEYIYRYVEETAHTSPECQSDRNLITEVNESEKLNKTYDEMKNKQEFDVSKQELKNSVCYTGDSNKYDDSQLQRLDKTFSQDASEQYQQNQDGKNECVKRKCALFAKETYKDYTQRGRFQLFPVWPALFLYKGGPLLNKGVAQGTNEECKDEAIAPLKWWK